MKITKAQKDIFIKDIIRSLPSIDYVDMAQKLAQDDILKRAPDCIKEAYKNKEYRTSLKSDSNYFSGLGHVYYIGGFISDEVSAQIKEIADKSREQKNSRDEMTKKLESAIYPINTREKLALAFPEFESYLPDAEVKTANLPMIVGLVDDLKAMGWVKPVDAEAVSA